jgi:hypothetical protein
VGIYPIANNADRAVRTLPLRKQFALARVSMRAPGLLGGNHRLQDFRKI